MTCVSEMLQVFEEWTIYNGWWRNRWAVSLVWRWGSLVRLWLL